MSQRDAELRRAVQRTRLRHGLAELHASGARGWAYRNELRRALVQQRFLDEVAALRATGQPVVDVRVKNEDPGAPELAR